MLKKLFSLVLVLLAGSVITAGTVNFDDLSLSSESYWNGSDGSGGFTSGSASFNNYCNTAWNYWESWSYSNVTDNKTAGLTNQCSAITGSALSGKNYGVVFVGFYGIPTITLDTEAVVSGMYVTNTTYAYKAMLSGMYQGKKFGDADWFLLTITGHDETNAAVGTVEFYLAEGSDILNTWQYVDLSGLGVVSSLTFSLSSSDNAPVWGMNTPGYFAMDNLIIPEPASLMLLTMGSLLFKRK
jgi:hypothetical protein